MKTYIPLILLLWLAACSSPAAQNASTENTTQKHDTIAAENEEQAPAAKQNPTAEIAATVSDTAKKEIIKGQIYLNDDEYTVPPYGLDKIKALVEKIEVTTEEGDGGVEEINEKKYNSLSLKEKFTYHIVHPENYSQICDPFPTHGQEANRIYGSLSDTYGEYTWSERQANFFKNNRVEVAQIMKELIAKEHRIGNNLKEVIIEMNGTELIPYLIDTYKKEKKDHYILTLLLVLMKNNNYPEFVNSSGYKKLYGEKAQDDYMHASYLVYNKANEDLIIQRATNFYNGLQAK
jgi:hypothetical protein